jgi:hypothetical protein
MLNVLSFLFLSERRLVGDDEYPLVLRVNLGPHEDISKLYIFDKNNTTEVNYEVCSPKAYLLHTYVHMYTIPTNVKKFMFLVLMNLLNI